MSEPLLVKAIHLDDDPFEIERVQKALSNHALPLASFELVSFDALHPFQEYVTSHSGIDLVVLDIDIGEPEVTGLDLISFVRSHLPTATIVMRSTLDDAKTVQAALQKGADDFISKKSDHGELSLRLFHALRLAQLRSGYARAQQGPNVKSRIAGDTMFAISNRVPLILNSAVSAVHVRGETGTGKEVVADLFRELLPTSVPLLRVNCGAIAPNLLESELFGYVKGAFTGALQDKKGLLEAASTGWIFLDEVSCLTPTAQAALLRALENHEIVRVGGTSPITVQFRVLSAAHENLSDLVKHGKFRKDLWQRLCETEIELPPLRERRKEIESLIAHFCRTMERGPYQISKAAIDVLKNHSWSDGNIRELRNCLRAMTEFSSDQFLTPLSIPKRIWDLESRCAEVSESTVNESTTHANINLPPELSVPLSLNLSGSYKNASDALLVEMLKHVHRRRGKLTLRQVAKEVDLSTSTLSDRLKVLIHREVASFDELSQYVNIRET